MAKILIIEDDSFIATELRVWLQKENHVVDIASTGDDGYFRLMEFHYDLAVIDWNLPDLTGIEICHKLQAERRTIPTLILTSRAEVNDRIQGLDAGALDYIIKPCSLQELSARIRALLRRPCSNKSERSLKFADITIQLDARQVFVGDRELELSHTEYDILSLLVKTEDRALDYKEIAQALGKGEQSSELRNSIKTIMGKIRKKLAEAKSCAGISFKSQAYVIDRIDTNSKVRSPDETQ